MKFFPAHFYPTIPYKIARLWAKKAQQMFALFFNKKFLANLNYFASNDRVNNFTSDSEKLIAVCYSQQKLKPFKKMFPNGKIVNFGLNKQRKLSISKLKV